MIPLPNALDGQLVERRIIIDAALLYILNGALSLMLVWQFEQTGTLTPDDVAALLSTAFDDWQDSTTDV